MSVCGTVVCNVECVEDFLETALCTLSPSEEENCVSVWNNAHRISLMRSLTLPTGIQLPAAHTAVRHSIAHVSVTEY